MKHVTTPLTSVSKPCLIMLVIVRHYLAAKIFQIVTIAHDKGKPVVRWGRKAVSLSECRERGPSWLRFERLSGCRRRSRKAKPSTFREIQVERFRRGKPFSSGNPVAGYVKALLIGAAVLARTTYHYSLLNTRRFAFFPRIPFFSVQPQDISRSLTSVPRKRTPDSSLFWPLSPREVHFLLHRGLSRPHAPLLRASFTD